MNGSRQHGRRRERDLYLLACGLHRACNKPLEMDYGYYR